MTRSSSAHAASDILQRHRAEAREPVRPRPHHLRDRVVLQAREPCRHAGVELVRERRRQRAEHLQVDPGRVHVGDPPGRVPAARVDVAKRHAVAAQLTAARVVHGQARPRRRRCVEAFGRAGEVVRVEVDSLHHSPRCWRQGAGNPAAWGLVGGLSKYHT